MPLRVFANILTGHERRGARRWDRGGGQSETWARKGRRERATPGADGGQGPDADRGKVGGRDHRQEAPPGPLSKMDSGEHVPGEGPQPSAKVMQACAIQSKGGVSNRPTPPLKIIRVSPASAYASTSAGTGFGATSSSRRLAFLGVASVVAGFFDSDTRSVRRIASLVEAMIWYRCMTAAVSDSLDRAFSMSRSDHSLELRRAFMPSTLSTRACSYQEQTVARTVF